MKDKIIQIVIDPRMNVGELLALTDEGNIYFRELNPGIGNGFSWREVPLPKESNK